MTKRKEYVDYRPLLRERGLKQIWVAQKLNITPSMFNQWLTGYRPMPLEVERGLKRIIMKAQK